MRVVSLLPSATETICLIGGGELLVGRSHECDFPARVRELPALTGQPTAFESSRQIDTAVRERLAAGEALYLLDVEGLESLAPDVVVAQSMCRVCSVEGEELRRVCARFAKPPEVITLETATIDGVFDDALRLGEAIDREDAALRAVSALRERCFRAIEHVNPYTHKPSVAVLDWVDPLFIAGHWTPQLVERAGGAHPLNPTVADEGAGAAAGMQESARRAGPSRETTAGALVASAPEYLVVCPCGLTLDQARAEIPRLTEQDWWGDLPAVRAGRVAVVDGTQMFSRPGPRVVDALEWLVGWLNGRPELIPGDFPWEEF